ncbi:MAG: disulfide bond formation protein B [Pseudomonadota bacterium]
MQLLDRIQRHAAYWLALAAFGLMLEGVALYYQYGLDYGPCILCTHARAWILGTAIVALLAIPVRGHRAGRLAAHGLIGGLVVGLTRTSWETLGVERGWIEGSCTFDDGYPSWLPLHEWLPSVFEAWELCGYTPELLFGVTMAEGLMVGSVLALAYLVAALAAPFASGGRDAAAAEVSLRESGST